MPVQQSTFIAHYLTNPLVVDTVMTIQSQTSQDSEIPVSGAVLDHIGNGLIDDDVITAWG